MSFPLEEIYDEFLRKEQETNREKYSDHKGWFSASSAGSCYKKVLYRALGTTGEPLRERPLRLLRLGTQLHADFEDAVKWWIDSVEFNPNEWLVFAEERIELENLNVVGHGDIWAYHKPTRVLYGMDLKTAGTVKWRLKYGRNPIPAENYMYEMQLATYGMGMVKKIEDLGFVIDNVVLEIIWYKKDDSVMKREFVDYATYAEMAMEYWEDLCHYKEELDSDELDIEELQFGDPGIPMQPKWECKYCEFVNICRKDLQ